MDELRLSFEKHILIQSAEQSAVSILSENCPQISKQKLKQAMQFGAVWLSRSGKTNRLRRAKKQLHVGDELHLYYDEAILFSKVKPAVLVAVELEFSIWNKPCGMFSQGTKWGDHTAICRWVELSGFKLNNLPQKEVYLVHRLDRATSGLIIVAHNKKMASKLSKLFESRQIEKHYQATVKGEFSGGEENDRIETKVDGKDASTQILKIEYDAKKNSSEILLKLETGRKHQIRVHLSSLGFPIVGDRLYANDKSDFEDLPDLQLSSCFLSFCSPVDNLKHSYSLG
jgi:tRNA pseudouridine32 synthase / 23S rRNA pseudouridine746 synthase